MNKSNDTIINNNPQINMPEPQLSGVKTEDRTMVRNVIYVLHAIQHPARLCQSWNVTNTRIGYDIVGLIEPSKDFEVSLYDLEMLHGVDPLRVQNVSVRKTGDAPQIVIRVLSRTEPITLTELDVVTIRKKRRKIF
jgi:hypothetical protein